MLKNNKSVIVAALMLALTMTAINVSANTSNTQQSGSPETQQHQQMKDYQTQLDAAIESGSYEAFKTAVTNLPMGKYLLEKITADNFDKFVEAHNYQKQANDLMEKSRTIMDEIGFNHAPGAFMHHPMFQGHHNK